MLFKGCFKLKKSLSEISMVTMSIVSGQDKIKLASSGILH
jgi:hypothetical protein